MSGFDTPGRRGYIDAKASVANLITRSVNVDHLSDRELAALCRRSAKRALYRFEQTPESDEYERSYWATGHHEYLSWEEHYRRCYRAEEAAR